MVQFQAASLKLVFCPWVYNVLYFLMFVSWFCLCSIHSGMWAWRVGSVLVQLKSKLYRLQCRQWWRSQGETTTCPCRTFTSSLFSSCLQRIVSHPPRSLHSLNMDFYLLEDNVVSPNVSRITLKNLCFSFLCFYVFGCVLCIVTDKCPHVIWCVFFFLYLIVLLCITNFGGII